MPNIVTLFLTFKIGHHIQDTVIGIWLIYFQGTQLYLNVPVYITLLFLIVLTLATSLNKNEGKKGKREGGRKGRKKGKRETTQIDNFLIWFIFTELNNLVCFPFSKLLIQQPFSIGGATWGGKVCVVWTEDCCSEFCTPKSSQTLLTSHLCPQLDFSCFPSSCLQASTEKWSRAMTMPSSNSEFNKVWEYKFMTDGISLWNQCLLFSNHTHREIYWSHKTLKAKYIWSILNRKKMKSRAFLKTP